MKITFAAPGLSTDPTSREGKRARKVIGTCAKAVGKATLNSGAIVFTVDRAFDRRSSANANAKALEALMVALTDLSSLYLRCFPDTPALYDSGVYYRRTEIWDTVPALYARGFGDCKSLAACRVAELRRQGYACRPVFRFATGPSMTMFHILVMHSDGTFEDPSKILGMVAPQETPA